MPQTNDREQLERAYRELQQEMADRQDRRIEVLENTVKLLQIEGAVLKTKAAGVAFAISALVTVAAKYLVH